MQAAARTHSLGSTKTLYVPIKTIVAAVVEMDIEMSGIGLSILSLALDLLHQIFTIL